MNNKMVRFAKISIVSVCMVMAISKGMAEPPKAPVMPSALLLRKTGIVRVVKDKSGKVTAIKLVVTSYEITLDEGSKQLETMDGQKVKVIATYKREGDKRWLTVNSVEPVVVEKEKVPQVKPEKAKKPEKKPEKAPEKP